MRPTYCNLVSPYCSGSAADRLRERLAAADRERSESLDRLRERNRSTHIPAGDRDIANAYRAVRGLPPL